MAGTGLFIGSGQALSTGGPASLLISYILIGVVLFCTVQALGEMAVTFPVAGSFSAFATVSMTSHLSIAARNLTMHRDSSIQRWVLPSVGITPCSGW